ncbi:MAG: hypothetical protein AAGA48_11430 [Myxococcota bacterium]
MARAIERTDWFRRPPSRIGFEPGFKEWMHFCIYAGGLDLLVNFSEVDHPSGSDTDVRQTLMVQMNDRWHGAIDTFPAGAIGVRGGTIEADFGPSGLRFENGRYRLWAQTHSTPEIRLDVSLSPMALPVPVYNVVVGDSPPIHWVVVPRLHATGEVSVGERRLRLDRTPAYHDHNWGHFRWGRDFAWEWGFAIPAEPHNPWSFVFARLNDRSLTRILMQTAFLWHGARPAEAFRDTEITIRHEGLLRPSYVHKLPPVMALLSQGSATDIPARVIIEAHHATASVYVTFESRAVAQVIIPNDDDLGVTIINEVSGSCHVQGKTADGPIELTCNTVFEFLGA